MKHVEFVPPIETEIDKTAHCLHKQELDGIASLRRAGEWESVRDVVAGNVCLAKKHLGWHPFTILKFEALRVLSAIPIGRLESFRYLPQVQHDKIFILTE